MRVLVTGHRGYIGATMCAVLKQHGHYVVGIDCDPDHKSIDDTIDAYYDHSFEQQQTMQVIEQHGIDNIFHFAASVSVPESVANPSKYYNNNTANTAKLLDMISQSQWKGNFVFSSTAAVYGDCTGKPSEWQKTLPINPYGASKLLCENIIHDVVAKSEFNVVIFRYFNVAGAHPDTGCHLDGSHVIPSMCRASTDNMPFVVYGKDYVTPDGTCVRDYVHVIDICRAHLHAVDYLTDHPGCHTFNLGSGNGFSVLQLVEAFNDTADLIYTFGIPRAGDPSWLVASNEKFVATGFEYAYTDVHQMIKSTWHCFQQAKTGA